MIPPCFSAGDRILVTDSSRSEHGLVGAPQIVIASSGRLQLYTYTLVNAHMSHEQLVGN